MSNWYQVYKPIWSGHCEQHGDWENSYKNGCVFEQWEQEREQKRQQVQLKLSEQNKRAKTI